MFALNQFPTGLRSKLSNINGRREWLVENCPFSSNRKAGIAKPRPLMNAYSFLVAIVGAALNPARKRSSPG